MDPEIKKMNFIFPTKYVIPKSLKFSHWPSKKNRTSNQPRVWQKNKGLLRCKLVRLTILHTDQKITDYSTP